MVVTRLYTALITRHGSAREGQGVTVDGGGERSVHRLHSVTWAAGRCSPVACPPPPPERSDWAHLPEGPRLRLDNGNGSEDGSGRGLSAVLTTGGRPYDRLAPACAGWPSLHPQFWELKQVLPEVSYPHARWLEREHDWLGIVGR